MTMKRIDISIRKYLLDRRNEDVEIGEMCNDLCMTRRQMISRITRADMPYVIRVEQDAPPMHYRMECSLTEAELATEKILADFYNIDCDDVKKVINVLSIAGSMTLDDIAYVSGMEVRETAYILKVSPMVIMNKIGSTNQYIKRMDETQAI